MRLREKKRKVKEWNWANKGIRYKNIPMTRSRNLAIFSFVINRHLNRSYTKISKIEGHTPYHINFHASYLKQ